MGQLSPTHVLTVYDDRARVFLQTTMRDAEFDPDCGVIRGVSCDTGFDVQIGIGQLHTYTLLKVDSPITAPQLRVV